MAKNLKQVLQQIEQLQREAESLRSKEVEGVIERIKEAIAAYSITPEQLFGTSRAKAKNAVQKPAKGGRPAKYRDASGQTWSGVGKRPRWFVQALEAGIGADSLLVSQPGRSAAKARGRRKATASLKAAGAGQPKYQDPSSGKTWTGRGKRPEWFVTALAEGKSAEDLLISHT